MVANYTAMPPVDFVLPLHPRHAARVYNGTKKYEFRRRAVAIPAGSWAYVYETRPTGAVTGLVRFGKSFEGEHARTVAKAIKDTHWRESAVQYLQGAGSPVAVMITHFQRLPRPVPLARVRAKNPSFMPPQTVVRADTPTGLAVVSTVMATASSALRSRPQSIRRVVRGAPTETQRPRARPLRARHA